MMRIGCVEYINALPFYLPFRERIIKPECELVYTIPSELNHALRIGDLDCALTSCVEFLDGDYQMIPEFGIAANKRILSVNLYTQFPIPSLSGKRIGVTHHSATSIALLKVLCHHFWHIDPYFEPLDRDKPPSEYAGVLLIGDEGLRNATLPGFETIDLASAWFEVTGLPFVFALFAANKQMSAADRHLLHTSLNQALNWSEAHKEHVEQKAQEQCHLPLELIKEYYTLCKYRLGPEELEGLNTFKKLHHVSQICS